MDSENSPETTQSSSDYPDQTSPLKTKSFSDTLISHSKGTPTAAFEPMMRFAQRCHIGAVRARNEDASFSFISATGGQDPLIPFGLFVVADGMGGHQDGHMASRLASHVVGRKILSAIYLPLLNPSAEKGRQQPVQETIFEAVQEANLALHQGGKESGTTLTAALILGRRLYLAHVGDSRAYLYTDERLEIITVDHSYVRRLQDVGQLTAEEAASHPHRNVLYRAVGQGAELEIDTFTRALPAEGKLVLCSDGLWGLVPDPMLQSILEEDITLQQMVDKTVELAIQAGGHDNITIILVDFAL